MAVVVPPSPASVAAAANNETNEVIANNVFTPIFAQSIWQNSQCEKVVAVAVLLPSGVVDKSHSKVAAVDEGDTLEVWM